MKSARRGSLGFLMAAVIGIGIVTRPLAAADGSDRAQAVTVFGAASLTNVLQELGDSYARAQGVAVRFQFAASSQLARQIEAGARADLFVSADQEWMDYLEQRALIAKSSRSNLLGNRLALVAPVDSKIVLPIAPHFALLAALGREHLATGDPDSVPVGKYARAALNALGVWNDVAERIVRADNVRSALLYVDRGEVPLGIVYETDARVDPKVRIVDLFPENTHAPITYPIALTPGASADAAKFLGFLRSPQAQAVFRRYGFMTLP